jgi:SAM-dependent methyltransferase
MDEGRILEVNRRYHDVAAGSYDHKWGVGFDEVGRAQVVAKVAKLLGPGAGPFGDALEIGAGTGYFSLNLARAGVVGRATCTDISPGMVAALERNARELGVEVRTAVCEATALPFPDGSFDVVLGHAVLHHLPDLERAFREFRRVLRPGGIVLFAGEPSRLGDRLAAAPKRAGRAVAPLWRRLLGARPALDGTGGGPGEDDHALESEVDVHAFGPGELERPVRAAGFEDVRLRGEELLANWFGWFNRSVEATARFEDIPRAWLLYAFRGYLALQAVDRRLLEPRLPAPLFYNLLLSARAPSFPAR